MGRVAEARPVLEEGLRLLASKERKPRRSVYILDTGVTYLCMLAKVLASLGDFDQALEKAGAALELANSLEHPPSITYATFWTGWVHHARGDFAAACAPLDAAMEMSRKYGLPQFLEWSRLLRGSSMAHLGHFTEGVAELRLSVENQLSMRCMLERPFCLALLADALLASGSPGEALKLCDEAGELSQRTGGKSYEAQTLHIRELAIKAIREKTQSARTAQADSTT
jgi:ATP/maltotriose-dependent transcriptional regulator MalT